MSDADIYEAKYDEILLGATWQERETYGRFYEHARQEIAGCATGTPYPVEWWCRAAAALSPLKSWATNMKCLWGLHNYLELAGWPTNENLMRDIDPTNVKVGQMVSPTEAALRALAWGKYPTGLKTGPFARNLEGNLREVTIDRHMTRAAGIESDSPTYAQLFDMQAAIVRLAGRTGYFPAVVQAIIWGVWRDRKGLPVTEHGNGLPSLYRG